MILKLPYFMNVDPPLAETGKADQKESPKVLEAVVPLCLRKRDKDWIKLLHIWGCRVEHEQLFSVLLWQKNKSPKGGKPCRSLEVRAGCPCGSRDGLAQC